MKLPFALLINVNFVSASSFHMERFKLSEEIVYPQNLLTTTGEPSKLEFFRFVKSVDFVNYFTERLKKSSMVVRYSSIISS